MIFIFISAWVILGSDWPRRQGGEYFHFHLSYDQIKVFLQIHNYIFTYSVAHMYTSDYP